jgi:tetratricopeptide (TPR) repeat protein
MRKVLFITSLFLFIGFAGAQSINITKAEAAIEDGFYERAYKLTTEAIEHEQTKKDPLAYYFRAISLYHLSKEEFFVKKNPDALKDACKMVIKGQQKDKEKQYKERFEEFVAELVKTNNAVADEEYLVKRFSKAIKLYNVSYSLNGDTTAYYMIGKSYQFSADTSNAKFYFKNLVNWYNEAVKSGKSVSNAYIDPFLFLTDVHWAKKNYDSANYYLDVARSVFGDKNARINFYQYSIAKQQVASQPPSSLMMEIVKKALIYSPADTFFIKKENALALYLIRNHIDAANFKEADTMIGQFARSKALKGNDPSYQSLKETDIFLQPFAENVMWKMSDYYYMNTHDKASAYLAKIYIRRTANSSDTVIPTDKEIIARWMKIIEFAAENSMPGYVSLLMNQAITDYPASKELTALKKKLLIK